MKIFKNYFKILKSYWFSIAIYSIIFMVVLLFSTRSDKSSGYKSVKVSVYIKDDSSSQISKALYNYLDKTCNIEQMDENLVEDKLFYQFISASIKFPKDFEKNRQVIFKSAPKDTYAIAVKENINEYLNQLSSYERAGFSIEEAISYTSKDLEKKVDVSLNDKKARSIDRKSQLYFNFLSYSILAQLILVVSNVSLVYKDKRIYKRNAISPISSLRQNLELFLGHLITGLAFWLIYMLAYIILFGKSLNLEYVRLLMLNSFVFTMTTVSMAIFIGRLTKSGNSMHAIMNIVSLGSSFLSGAFVSQRLLGPTATKLGKFLPAYYYVLNNNMIVNGNDIGLIKRNIFIMFAFTIFFICLSSLVKENLKKTL